MFTDSDRAIIEYWLKTHPVTRLAEGRRTTSEVEMASLVRGDSRTTRYERCSSGLILPVLYGDDLRVRRQ